MGNEMGNRNVSGLQEEDNAAVEAQEKSLQEAVHDDDLKEENQILPAAEGKDYHEKVTGLDSDDPSIVEDHLISQTSDKKEQDRAEVQPADASPKVQANSNDAGDEDSGILPAPSSEDVGDHDRLIDPKSEGNTIETSDCKNQKQISEELIDSKSEENVSETSEPQTQKETSIIRETEKEQDVARTSSLETNSVPHNSELLESAKPVSDQHELAIIHAEPPVEDHTESPHENKEVQGPNLTGHNNDKGDLLDTEVACSLAGYVVSEANVDVEKGESESVVKDMANVDVEKGESESVVKDMAFEEEKMVDTSIDNEPFDITDGNEAGIEINKITSNILSDSENKCNGELSTEMNINWNNSSGLPSVAIPLATSLNSHEEVSEIEDKCMVLTEETKLIGSGSEVSKLEHKTDQFYDECLTADTEMIGNGLKTSMLDENPLQFCNELVKESNTTDEPPSSESMPIEINHDNKGKEGVGESPNLASEEHCKDSEREAEMACEMGRLPTELTVTDCDPEREEPIEKKIIEEGEEIEEDAHATVEDTKGVEVTEKSVSQYPAIKQAESLLSQSPAIGSESLQESKMLTVEEMVFAVELEKEEHWEDLSQYNEKNRIAMEMEEIAIPAGAEQSNEQCVKDETSAFASGAYEARESMEWLRNDQSNSQKLNLPIQIRRSPSFNFDLLVEARAEESDQTPLLYQDKPATRSFSSRIDVNITKPIATADYIQGPLKCQAISVEEKTIPKEKGDPEKVRTPFLSLMKEEEEAHILVTPQRNDSSLVAAKKAPKELPKPLTDEGAASVTSLRIREKQRKPRSSLFTNCMCCAAVIN